MKHRRKKTALKKIFGFSLTELLIVISIIGILMSITIVGFKSIKAKARDGQRKTDLSSMQAGLESFYMVNKEYPNPQNGDTDKVCKTAASAEIVITGFKSVNTCLNTLGYTRGTYRDPSNPDNLVNLNNFVYRYAVNQARSEYEISAKIENTSDKAAKDDCIKNADTDLCDDNRIEYGKTNEVDTSGETSADKQYSFTVSATSANYSTTQ